MMPPQKSQRYFNSLEHISCLLYGTRSLQTSTTIRKNPVLSVIPLVDQGGGTSPKSEGGVTQDSAGSGRKRLGIGRPWAPQAPFDTQIRPRGVKRCPRDQVSSKSELWDADPGQRSGGPPSALRADPPDEGVPDRAALVSTWSLCFGICPQGYATPKSQVVRLSARLQIRRFTNSCIRKPSTGSTTRQAAFAIVAQVFLFAGSSEIIRHPAIPHVFQSLCNSPELETIRTKPRCERVLVRPILGNPDSKGHVASSHFALLCFAESCLHLQSGPQHTTKG